MAKKKNKSGTKASSAVVSDIKGGIDSVRVPKVTAVVDNKGRNDNETSSNKTTKTIVSSTRVILLGMILLTIGAMGFYNLPGMISSEAKGSRLVNSIYCSAITLTTIGFGDICPSGTLPPISKLFIVLFAFSGLGFFCGPLLDVASSWTKHIPGGLFTLTSFTIGIGVLLFSNIEGISTSDAVYASFIVGTTIGYGDYTPKSDMGKLAVAAYAIMVVNVVASLLRPSRELLEGLCEVPVTLPSVEDSKRKKDE